MTMGKLLRGALLTCVAATSACSGFHAGTGQVLPSAAEQGLPSLAGIASPAVVKKYVVTSAADTGTGTLRNTLAAAKAGATITFKLKKHATIALTSGALDVKKGVTISDPGSTSQLLPSARRAGSRIFTIEPGAKVTLTGLTLTNGSATQGGAIYNAGPWGR